MRKLKSHKRSLGPGQVPVVKIKYAHMLPRDYETWSMFLVRRILELDEVWYDVHVGRPMLAPEGSPEYILKVIAGVSRKRIDVVARLQDIHYLIEVKPHANMEAVGQVLVYRQLFNAEFDEPKVIFPMVVSKTADADVLKEADRQGVMIYPMKGVLL